MVDYPNPFRRTHSRKSKSQSVLPVHHPELEPCHRRSGIRHFSHVPSVRCIDGTTTTIGKGRKFSNLYRKQGRSVSGPLQWRELLDRVAGLERMPSEPGERVKRIAETKRKQEMERINGIRDGVMTRVPPKGKGVVIVPDTTPWTTTFPTYPYPQHIPPAAAPQYAAPAGVFVPFPPPTAVAGSSDKSSDNIMFMASGIAIAIAALLAWTFQTEVLRYGGTIGVAFLAWKLCEWSGQRRLQNHEKQRRLIPEQPQQYIVHPVVQTGYIRRMPGGW